MPDNIVLQTGSHLNILDTDTAFPVNMGQITNFFTLNYTKEFSFDFDQIKTTVSRDWAVFSSCYVIGIKSDTINCCVRDFNKQFGTNIYISPHITFGIQLRSLFSSSLNK